MHNWNATGMVKTVDRLVPCACWACPCVVRRCVGIERVTGTDGSPPDKRRRERSAISPAHWSAGSRRRQGRRGRRPGLRRQERRLGPAAQEALWIAHWLLAGKACALPQNCPALLQNGRDEHLFHVNNLGFFFSVLIALIMNCC